MIPQKGVWQVIGDRKKDILDILKRTWIADGLSDVEMEHMLDADYVRLVRYPKGSIIFDEDTKPDRLLMLVNGRVTIQKDTFLGRRIFLGEVNMPGDLFGEVYLFLSRGSYDMYTEAAADTELLEISMRIFDVEDREEAIRLQRNLLRILSAKAFALHNKVKVLASGTLREKIARMLFQLPHTGSTIMLPENREATAAYLAVSRPSLSRELGQMQQDGLIKVDGRKIVISDPERIEQYL